MSPPHQVQKFVAGVLIVLEAAEHRARDGSRVLFLDAAHDHTQMLGFDHNGHALWFNSVVNDFGDLHRQALLHLQAPGEHIDKTGDLAQSNDLPVGNIGDMAFSEKRKEMVFTKTEDLNVPDDYHLVIRHLEQSAVQDLLGIHAVAAGQIAKGAINTFRGFLQSIARGIFAELLEYASDLFNHRNDYSLDGLWNFLEEGSFETADECLRVEWLRQIVCRTK